MASTGDTPRARQLSALFKSVLQGNRQVRSSKEAKLFLEAVQNETPPGACVERIIASPSGLNALRDGLRADLAPSFVRSYTLKCIDHLSDDGVRVLADGQLLRQVLEAIVSPPTLWNCLVNMCCTHAIPDDELRPLARLLLQLLMSPDKLDSGISRDIESIMNAGILVQSQAHDTRELGYRIRKHWDMINSGTGQVDAACNPGGRHDNDFANFREIAIYPTNDELLSTARPFYRTAQETFGGDGIARAGIHIDNQFRLLREDMLAELREDLQVATGRKKGRRRPLILGGLETVEFLLEERGRYKPAALAVRCYSGLDDLRKLTAPNRKKFLSTNPNYLKHQAFGVLYRDDDIYGFAFVSRDIDSLCKSQPVVMLQFTDEDAFRRALLALKTPQNVKFTIVDTPVFAYEPVLSGLKRIAELPLHDVLLSPKNHNVSFTPSAGVQQLVEKLRKSPKTCEGQVVLPSYLCTTSEGSLSNGIHVDDSQLASLVNALQNSVSIIQGPPGTGKSFIGAHILNCVYKLSRSRILVITYTNHALDQFLEDLLKIGIPEGAMVRLGSKSKCTDATQALVLSEQNSASRRSSETWQVINKLKQELGELEVQLHRSLNEFRCLSTSWADIEQHLEFSENDSLFYEALKVPETQGNWKLAKGKKQKEVTPDYLFQRWSNGRDAGIFNGQVSDASRPVWEMTLPTRKDHVDRWRRVLLDDQLGTLQELIRQYKVAQQNVETMFNNTNVDILKNKRVIGCTTTAAAKYSGLIRQAQADIVLAEEAGEILESHILTSLSSTVKQLILIGDHKQLRPKVNNYSLTVEKGDGFDLNRSLFERLILQDAPYTTLLKQHRMVPEISRFAREMTYPDLLDGPRTMGRAPVRGVQNRVMFISHDKFETDDQSLTDRRDTDIKGSKMNTFEAEMVLKCVRYLAQQGYKTENMVVLTPYLGQLRKLRDMLKQDHDPVLNDLDAFELLRAGLQTQAASNLQKKPLRISTIDNYQGEESDIVIASLTRSNANGDIGFMQAPERLNVLVSRARDCLIMIGNPETFMKSRRGKAIWVQFFDLLKAEKQLYDGLPVRCEKHPEKTALLAEPLDFDKNCPDGGCAEPCDAPLPCGTHKCHRRCHRLSDHSQVECPQLIDRVCNRQHKTRIQCSKKTALCSKCVQEDKEQERRIKRDLRLEAERVARQESYARELQQLQDEIEHERRLIKYKMEEKEQKKTLDQQRADLASLKETVMRVAQRKKEENERKAQQLKKEQQRTAEAAKSAVGSESSNNDSLNYKPGVDGLEHPSSANEEWKHLKRFEMANSEALDKLMEMIGLETVKHEFLSVKHKVDTTVRQGISLQGERFNCSLLGNPGTGKTTVARLYAEFLTSMGVIPGSCFKETTGSSLANGGVSGCRGVIDDILNNGGGVLFIDEAYQLTSGNTYGGSGVLDYLLPEVENLVGKVVFVLAGYNKQMESFFAHNPGLPSRFPISMEFADYSDEELLQIFELKIKKKWSDQMQCEDGLRGLYCRVVARRIGRGRGRDGFGNARAVENVLARIQARQAVRLRQERRAGNKADDFLLTKEDLIGPEPSGALSRCKAWTTLRTLIGLAEVKEAVTSLVDSVQQNYQRELDEQPPIEYSLNKIFLGSPGTGKTTVAKLYGQILVHLGLLSKGEVVVKNPSDFVGGALGQSEQQTKGILAAASGKVLVIDEAYGLYGGGGGGGGGTTFSDPYKTAVIDTIVAEVQSVPGDDRCVLLLGYKEQMEEMLQNVNPGLSRRFPLASAFNFVDFTDVELREILDLKLRQQGFEATDQAKSVAMEMLDRARNRPNFGNAGEIDIILDATKARHQRRYTKKLAKSPTILEAVDFDENFDRAANSEMNVRKLFEGEVGREAIIRLLEDYQETVRKMKDLEIDVKESIPFNFLFRGPPGTGKTTTAKKMGQVFYDMGFLATSEVVECSASDLVGQYVGQTGPKVRKLMDRALGRVLFVDEAYRLAEGPFAKEAVDELVDSVTKSKYHKKLVIMLAGYTDDINQLMSINPGLSSRFPEVIDFHSLSPEECLALTTGLLRKTKEQLVTKGKIMDLDALERPSTAFKAVVLQTFTDLALQQSWASARDVGTLAKAIFNKSLKAMSSTADLKIEETTVNGELKAMLAERASRESSTKALKNDDFSKLAQLVRADIPNAPPRATTNTAFHQKEEVKSPEVTERDQPEQKTERRASQPGQRKSSAVRDAGVSDEVWEQLQRDKKAEEKKEKEYQELLKAAREAADADREKILKRLLEEEERRKKEAEMRKKLEMMGCCPAGFAWIRQSSGYCCAGGSHYRSDADLASST